MSLPTDLESDFTNPADEIPTSAYEPEADPAFDADPLVDATGVEAKADSGMSTGAIVGISIASVAVLGAIGFMAYKSRQ